MKVSMARLFAEVGRQAPNCRLILKDVERHCRELVRGEITLQEFAEFYCLTEADLMVREFPRDE